MLLDDDALAVSELNVLDPRTPLPPGSVLAATAGSVTVTTGTNDVELLGLRTLEGQALTVDEITGRYGLRPGARLPEPSGEELAHLSELGEKLARHEDYWTSRLAGSPVVDLSRVTAATIGTCGNGSDVERPGRFKQALPADGRSVLRGVDRPRSDEVVAALVGFLARLTGERIVGVAYADAPSGDRPVPSASLVAPTVPLIRELDSSHDFSTAHVAVLEELDDARRRGPYPRDLVVRRPELRGRLEPMEVAIRVSASDSAPAVAGATLTVVVLDGGEEIEWIYDRRSLDDGAVTAMSQRFDAFLSAVAADINRPLAALPVLTEAETRRLLFDWNDTSVDYPRDVCVHELVERQASRTPDRIALVCNGREISYGELIRQADVLARRLRDQGVEPGRRVGVCLERSVDLVVCLLAILKAGGAYVPFDPSYPPERIRFMIEDAEPTVVVCQRATADLLASTDGLLVLDDEPPSFSMSHDVPLDSISRPDDPAYVIYTPRDRPGSPRASW